MKMSLLLRTPWPVLLAAPLAFCAMSAQAQSFGFVPLQSFGQVINGITVQSPSGDLLAANDGTFYSPMADYGYLRFTSTGVVSVVNGNMTYQVSIPYYPWWQTYGDAPNALMQGTDGNFYGTTEFGAGQVPQNSGSVFSMNSAGALTYTGASVGSFARGSLVQGSDGAFYGVYGTPDVGGIFNTTTAGVMTTLHSFSNLNGSGINSDGNVPLAGLALGADGNFYGTTSVGGAYGHGTVFKITPAGVLTTLHSFTGADGADPRARLILASDGNFYGTTQDGGAHGDGTIFRISPSGTFTSLHAFAYTDGMNPASGLVQSISGTTTYLYGTTPAGGSNNSGTLFSITTTGTFHSLYSFSAAYNSVNNDGVSPNGLASGQDGNLFGTTRTGGSAGVGEAFEVIIKKPTLKLSFNPAKVNPYQNSTLTWTAKSATSCQASGAWSGSEPVSGTQIVSQPVSGSYLYTLTCYGPLGKVSKSATLTVK